MASNTIDIALDYITWNPAHKIFPVAAGCKLPPCFEGYQAKASNDPEQLRKWHTRYPGCSWGVEPANSGIVVLDADLKKGKKGQASLDDLEMMYGPLPATSVVITPSGGKHFRFKATAKVKHKFRVNGFGEHLDSPMYTVIPGCVMRNGGTYEYANDLPLADAPDWFLELPAWSAPAATERPNSNPDAKVELDKPENREWAINFLKHDAPMAIEGQNGSNTTYKVACELRGRAISEIEAKILMEEHYNIWPTCDPIWETDALYAVIEHAYAYANLEAPGEATAEADFAGAPYVWKAGEEEKINARLAEKAEVAAKDAAKEASIPFDQRERRWTLPAVCAEWVWVADAKRFIKRDDLDLMWDKETFDDKFSYLKGKAAKLSKVLFGRTKDTIPKPDRMVYLPGKPEIFDSGTKYNLYRAPDLTVAPGDTTLWNAHIAYLFPEDSVRDHVLNWCAWLLQNISCKPKHALLVAGYTQGTGKSFIAEMLTAILGEANVSPIGEDELNGQFNEWALRSKLITIEELRTIDKGHVAKKLHPLITQTRIKINDKNVKRFTIDNCFGFFMMTNDDAAISLDNSDRRYLVARTHAVPNDKAYYDGLYKLLDDPVAVGAVAYELQHRDLGEYSGQARAPFTDAKGEMILAGLTDLEHWMIDHSGEYPLSGRIIAIDDVIQAMPSNVARTQRTRTTIASILRHRFKGISLGQHRLASGDRASLWAVNGTGATKIEGVNYATVYEKDRTDAGSGKSVNAAAEEFSS